MKILPNNFIELTTLTLGGKPFQIIIPLPRIHYLEIDHQYDICFLHCFLSETIKSQLVPHFPDNIWPEKLYSNTTCPLRIPREEFNQIQPIFHQQILIPRISLSNTHRYEYSDLTNTEYPK